MQPLSLDLAEKAALQDVVASKASAAALKKVFKMRCEYYSDQARHSLNAIPNNLHEQAMNHETAKQRAAMAKAYAGMWSELEAEAKR